MQIQYFSSHQIKLFVCLHLQKNQLLIINKLLFVMVQNCLFCFFSLLYITEVWTLGAQQLISKPVWIKGNKRLFKKTIIISY